ncbi:MAG: M48 family metalloprotease [Promethearchaeota archaeon]
MKKFTRYFLFVLYLFGSIGLFFLSFFILSQPNWFEIVIDWSFWLVILLYFVSIEEFLHWARIGKRSEMSDLIAIAFFFFVIFFFTKDLMTSLMGAFSIYLWVGLYELKEYPVMNKILIITLVTYNVVFIAGLFSFYYNEPIILNTAFSFSFWLILGLGFILFGRKYIIVWRFMSPTYLVLFLYILAWLAVAFINEYTPINFIYDSPLNTTEFVLMDFFLNIYFVLIVVNWIVYFFTGPLLGKLLGIKRVKNENLLNLVEEVKNNIGIKDKIKVGFGKYPILNAMAYGSIFDKRIAIIAEEIDQIPKDELKGIVAHELAHTKGNHTLILTFITSGDLFIRMLLGLPATYYDYTFGDPKIPMIGFIFMNLVIYMFLYVLVRILEGRADLMSKEAGYAKELAKALYNLESFYASGREIGLNTMLLCDEKINKDNQLLDYMDTANYIYRSMIKPSRTSLLGNLLNAHPPTYFRIAAVLDDGLKPGKEALLPFICLRKSKQQKYAKSFENARERFKEIATEKFKEEFKIENISMLLESINRRNLYNLDLNKDFLFKHKISNEIIVGTLENVQFLDNICEIDQLIVRDFKSRQIKQLGAVFYSRSRVCLNDTYFLDKKNPLILKDIELNDDKKDGFYIFEDVNQNRLTKQIKKTKLPNPVNIIDDFLNNDVFLKRRGELKIYKCVNIKTSVKLEDYELEFTSIEKSDERDNLQIRLSELIVRPKKIYFSISKSTIYRKTEDALFNWLINNEIYSYIYLKKPVNNLEIGYITDIRINHKKFKKSDENEEESANYYIIVKNIFGKDIKIPYKTLEIISFDYKTAMIQKKTETSFSSKMGYKIVKKFRPEKILYLDKI